MEPGRHQWEGSSKPGGITVKALSLVNWGNANLFERRKYKPSWKKTPMLKTWEILDLFPIYH